MLREEEGEKKGRGRRHKEERTAVEGEESFPCPHPRQQMFTSGVERESLGLQEPRAAALKWGPRPAGCRDNWLSTQPRA